MYFKKLYELNLQKKVTSLHKFSDKYQFKGGIKQDNFEIY
jgi:hypothetical protein